MIAQHWFWWLLTMAAIGWYSTVTVYVAVKGFGDVRSMLRRLDRARLAAGGAEKEGTAADAPASSGPS